MRDRNVNAWTVKCLADTPGRTLCGLRRAAFALILASVAVALPALAQSAFVTQSVNLRSGPDRAFPLVTWLPGGTRVAVFGCTSGWRWCDVAAGRNRGWVHSRYLSGPIRNRAPIIGFSVGSYWDLHYRAWPWYAQRGSWDGWGSPSFRPPPPPPPIVRPSPPRRPVVRPPPPPPPRPPMVRPPRPPQGPPDFGPPPAARPPR